MIKKQNKNIKKIGKSGNSKKSKKTGRPKKPVKPKTVEEIIEYLASKGATNTSIALFLKMDDSTLARNYENFLTKGRENLKITLREKQIEVALSGNPALLIWLGKIYLEQRERVVTEGNQILLSATHEVI